MSIDEKVINGSMGVKISDLGNVQKFRAYLKFVNFDEYTSL